MDLAWQEQAENAMEAGLASLDHSSRRSNRLEGAQLEWADINPWTGCLADSLGSGETTPFLPSTAPLSSCTPYDLLDYENVYLDSAYYADTTWKDEPVEADTTGFEAETPDTATVAPYPE